MKQSEVLIAGGGIGGLVLALTLHQIGVKCTVLESATELRPLGVGINLQPNGVRELTELGIGEEELDAVGIPAREWALVGLNGKEIYSEPRGKFAGYNWHQYAIHRGRFHMLLFNKVIERLGKDAVKLGHKVVGYEVADDGSAIAVTETGEGKTERIQGALLIGCDGIHSTVRAQMHPDQPPIHWGGTMMWRGTARAEPIRTGSSFVGLGTSKHRIVLYPITHADEDGLAEINWIAEQTYDDSHDWTKASWFGKVDIESFADEFSDFVYDFLDLPALLAKSDVAYENPMIDRDPVPTWVDGPVALLGDAAHPMYPVGSNGASQAIIDARVLGKAFLDHGVTQAALADYNSQLCEPVGQLAMRNRGAGPFGLLNLVEERCGGEFDDIEDVVPAKERAEFMHAYQSVAGFAKDRLNAAPSIIPADAQVGDAV